MLDPSLISLDSEVPKKTRPSAVKDPESGLTMDTIKRRKLCYRYDHMLVSCGLWHRIDEVRSFS